MAFTGQLLSPQCFGPSDPLCGPCSLLRSSGPARAQWPPGLGDCGERGDALGGWALQWPSQEPPCLFSATAFQNLPCQRVCGIRVAILHEETGLLVPSQTGKTWQTSPVSVPTTWFQGETNQDIGFLIHSGFFPSTTWEWRPRNFQFLNNSKRECLSQISVC